MNEEIQPYNSGIGKKKEVEQMFDNISPKYDLLNRILSAGVDVEWRNKVVKMISKENPTTVLDVATGTGDLAIEIAKKNPETKVTGYDLSNGMLEVGRKKVNQEYLMQQIDMIQGDAEHMPFDDNSFDVVTAAFGVRNFEDLLAGLKEMNRVLKPGGRLVILEFSQPTRYPMDKIYQFYFQNILPFIGSKLSKDARAYSYLPESVNAFPYGEEMLNILKSANFIEAFDKKLTFGIASIYNASK